MNKKDKLAVYVLIEQYEAKVKNCEGIIEKNRYDKMWDAARQRFEVRICVYKEFIKDLKGL